MTAPFRICVDIGGTFTDLYLRDGDGRSRSVKTPTTPDDLVEGLFRALSVAADGYDLSVEELLSGTERLIHGTTIATNAIIEGEVSTTALICTEGHPDVLTIREGGKDDPYDWDVDYPDPYVPRALTFEVGGRISAEGEVLAPLDEAGCLEAIERVRESDAEAVAVALLWSQANPVHERRVGELLDEHAPGLDYSLSSEVAPIIREYRRTSAAAINASLFGVVDEYLPQLQERLAESGFRGTPLIITANGGVMGIEEAARTPIWMVDAGPTMFPVAAGAAARAELGTDDVVALDMGGTSLDMGVVEGGTLPRSREATIEGDHMLGIEKVEITSVGSGGGSIARVDEGGLLHVGPESAGADPGPACYGRGGTEPTVTDAALVLGYLDPDYFLGGEMAVSREAAEEALEEEVGAALGVDATEAAHAVYAAATQNIVHGVRGITVERGVDPREYVLSGGGGALGTHAVPVARELGVGEVLLPREAGVVSAVGGLASDVRRDYAESHFTTGEGFDYGGVNDALESLESRALAFFDRADVPEERRSLSLFAEARYPNQVWELDVELPFRRVSADADDVEALVERFHRAHRDTYGFAIEEGDVEFLGFRVEATGENPDAESAVAPAQTREAPPGGAARGERDAYFDGAVRPCPAYRADGLSPGRSIEGPAFVDAATTTVVVPPDAELSVTGLGNYRVRP